MRRLGISVYPEHASAEQNQAYMERAARHGFSRIFTCLLSVTTNPADTVREFKAFMSGAHELGYLVAVDTSERVFERLGASPWDLSPFVEMGVDIIRLDSHFGDMGDIAITRNRAGIAIEFNASGNLSLETLIERGADSRLMTTCHNFYPEPYTGLSEESLIRYSSQYKRLGLPVAAFVSSQQEGTFGPWPVSAGLPTCEDDRRRVIDLQTRHLVATGLIDDVIIGNAFASEEELEAMASVDMTRVTMHLETVEGLGEAEIDVIWNHHHVTRGDASAYMLRSSMPRMKWRSVDGSVPPRTVPEGVLRRGDVVVVNDKLAHYRGELQVILQDIPDDGTRNLVGRVPEQEHFLLNYVAPDHPFGFIRTSR